MDIVIEGESASVKPVIPTLDILEFVVSQRRPITARVIELAVVVDGAIIGRMSVAIRLARFNIVPERRVTEPLTQATDRLSEPCDA